MKQKLALILFITGILIGSVFLVFQALSVQKISYDDGISYLAATGQQGAFHRDNPSNQWVPAHTWQSYWKPDSFGVFRTIGNDLATYDIHPPLYFWLLHIWIHITGVTLYTGPLLNSLLLILTAILIFLGCKMLKCSYWTCAIMGVLWILNSTIISTATEIRPYSLLSLTAAFFVLCLIYFLQKPSLQKSLLLGIATLTGILTHYHFGILLVILVILAVVHLIKKSDWKNLIYMSISLLSAGILFFAVHPHFYTSFSHQQNLWRAVNWAAIPSCISHCLFTVIKTFIPYQLAYSISVFMVKYWWFLLILIVSFCILFFIKRKQLCTERSGFLFDIKTLPFITLLITITAIWILYCSGMSPAHAMKTKYLMLVFPLIFIVMGQLINVIIKRWRIHPGIVFLLLIIYQISYGSPLRLSFNNSIQKQKITVLKKIDDSVIIDTVGRGILPPVLWHVKPQIMVYAASQKDILVQFPHLPDSDTLIYISNLRYNNTIKKRLHILEKFKNHGYKIFKLNKDIAVGSELYTLIKSIKKTN